MSKSQAPVAPVEISRELNEAISGFLNLLPQQMGHALALASAISETDESEIVLKAVSAWVRSTVWDSFSTEREFESFLLKEEGSA